MFRLLLCSAVVGDDAYSAGWLDWYREERKSVTLRAEYEISQKEQESVRFQIS